MKKIHFYKDTELVYSVYANSLDEVRANPEAYYKEFKNKMIISETEYTHPIIENETLREATRDELVAKGLEINLEEGEIIKRKRIIKIERPSQYHIWTGSEWTVDLEELKKNKREELKNKRDQLDEEDVEVNKNKFQLRKKDENKFLFIMLRLATGVITLEQGEEWVLADNTHKFVTYKEIKEVVEAKATRTRALFATFNLLDDKLKVATTVQEIEKIKWD